ncbi:MAG: glycogen-binding domain-containing protein [Kiritimatiellae bacterium]|nr:glycogen-binding domain-containing protein [Kiritimatiellia bacterium]MDD3546341.1 glycogen-binding domain-containing protein [Kiritimatiellia bacterium]MDD4622231.1 glycogen-binding domain-containing protein [Kiritimatiellia bacterium]
MKIKSKPKSDKPAVPVKASVKIKPVKTAVKKASQKPAVKTARVNFSVRAEKGSRVFLAGSFNNWDPSAKEMFDKNSDGVYTTTISLAPGSYQYKFVIDGTWCADPECADWVQNEHGTLNSVKQIL